MGPARSRAAARARGAALSGYVRISRGFFEDAAFADEAFTEREAFLWLIFEASFLAREVRVGSAVVQLKRGQIAASTRFMAKAWGWSEARVRRYLDRLKNRRMAERVTDAGVTVVTLCNYDKYQAYTRVADAPATQEPTHRRRTGDANEKEDEITLREEEEERATCDAVLAAAGLNPTDIPSSHWMPHVLETFIAKWRGWGLTDAQILTVTKETQRRFRGRDRPERPSAFDRAMERYAQALTAPPVPLKPALQPEGGITHVRAPARSRSTEALDAFVAGASDFSR